MIYYFSATGNSAYVARRIAEKLGDRAVNLAEAMQNDDMRCVLTPEETVGFVLPTYFYGIPVILHAFLYALEFVTDQMHYTWLVLTCGGSTGAAGDQFAGLMQDNGYRLSAYYSVKMPDNYLPLFAPLTGDKLQHVLDAADAEIDAICSDIDLRMSGNCDRHRGFVPGIVTRFAYPIYKRGRKTKKFTVSKACIGCGACAKCCPCEAIEMRDGKPVWVEDQCVLCLACLHRCPAGAIDYGKNTRKKTRYVNPREKK